MLKAYKENPEKEKALYARMCTPELSSIDNKYQLVGEYSVKLLTGLLEGSGEEQAEALQRAMRDGAAFAAKTAEA